MSAMSNDGMDELAAQWHNFLRVLRRRVGTLIIFAAVVMAVVVAGTWLKEPVYRATATILIDMETPTVLAVSRDDGDPTIGQTNYMTYADYYRTQLEIIDSRAIAKRVFDNLDLRSEAPYSQDPDPIGLLMDQVTIDPIKQTRLVQVEVEDVDPERAAEIANEFGRVFSAENLQRTVMSEALTLMKNEYVKLQAREAELSKRYKAKHPAMIRVHQEMDQLAEAINAQLSAQATPPPSRGKHRLPQPVPDLETSPAFLGNLKPNNIRIQNYAQPPNKPAKPNKPLNLALGLVLAVLGGLALVVIQELLDTSVKAPEDVERDRRLTLLGYIPRTKELQGRRGRNAKTQYLIHGDPYSVVAESYRALRTSLLHAVNGRARPIVFTSPAMAEGKTTTVCNLGIALAQAGKSALLVDADLRKGRLHEVFGLGRTPGLSEFLAGRAKLEAVVRPTNVPGLSVVTTGALPSHPAELLSSQRMREFLEQTGVSFDKVLVDSPPVIAVTDAAILASITQAVIGVAQSGRTPRQALHRLAGLCHQARAKLIGVILNNVPGWDAPVYTRYAAYRSEAAEERGQPAKTR